MKRDHRQDAAIGRTPQRGGRSSFRSVRFGLLRRRLRQRKRRQQRRNQQGEK